MNNTILIALIVIVLFSVFRYAPVDHINMVLGKQELIEARKQSRMTVIIMSGFCLGAALVFGPKNIIVISTMMGALTASVSLTIGSIKRGGERNDKIESVT